MFQPRILAGRGHGIGRSFRTGLPVILVALFAPCALAQEAPAARREPEALPLPRASVPIAFGEPSHTGFDTGLPGVPEAIGKTSRQVASFLDSVTVDDAMIEVVVGEGRVMVLREDLAVPGKTRPLVAVGDPSVIEFNVVGPRQIRITGQRLGLTDLSVTTAEGHTFSFQVHVVADLLVLAAQLKAMFPDATLKLGQIRDHVVVEGEARDTKQVGQIIHTIHAYLGSIHANEMRKFSGQSVGLTPAEPGAGGGPGGPEGQPGGGPKGGGPGEPRDAGKGPRPAEREALHEKAQYNIEATVTEPQVINLIRVPGSQQVLLKVRVAELNRTALRQIGADFLGVDPATGAILGTQIGGASVAATGIVTGKGVTGLASGSSTSSTTVFGIFQGGHFEFFLNALRSNSVLKILAEPNLVTMSGHPASFLAGGEFPVPVPQAGGLGTTVVTVAFREFGVRLGFVPYILDGDMIRLSVDPEVSNIDFTIGTVLVAGGTPVPGLNTRKSHTTVELRQGQTLAIAGLLQLSLDGTHNRIPFLGDLPVIGPLFSNTSSRREEKELVVLVTPYLVEPLNACQVGPTPGEEVKEPTDCEVFFLNRIEGKKPGDYRSTTEGQNPLRCRDGAHADQERLRGACGFSEPISGVAK